MTAICQSCHAGCCRAYAVPITGADVLRLERMTGLTFWDFACRWQDPDGVIAGDYAPHLFFDDEPLTPFTLCLLHEPSRAAPTTSRCRFLEESPPDAEALLGRGSCGVYGARPSACQVFPLKMQTASPLTVLAGVPAHGRPTDGHELYRLCPREWQPGDVDPIAGPQSLAIAEYEASFFRKVAALWNQRLGSWLQFPEFVREVYRHRVVRENDIASNSERPTEPVTLPFPTETLPGRRVA